MIFNLTGLLFTQPHEGVLNDVSGFFEIASNVGGIANERALVASQRRLDPVCFVVSSHSVTLLFMVSLSAFNGPEAGFLGESAYLYDAGNQIRVSSG